MRIPPVLPLVLLAVLALVASAAFADGGRTEINQAIVDASGGFPFTISAPGNFVLTGDLTVPADTHAIRLATDDVTIDLNGFAIAGPATCAPGSCVAGTGFAISGVTVLADADRVTVRNGTIRGFGGDCVRIRTQAHVERLLVTQCGGTGIVVTDGSIVSHNRIAQTGQYGIWMIGTAPLPTYAHNTIAEAALGPTSGFMSVAGGRASAGNSCEDGGCSPDGRRRYYLGGGLRDGAAAPAACNAGFHMASIWEILDPTQLHYDTVRGLSSADSGLGPPSSVAGWVRTGSLGGSHGSPGGDSCLGYTTNSGALQGTTATLQRDWEAGFGGGADSRLPWWDPNLTLCSNLHPVWCVED